MNIVEKRIGARVEGIEAEVEEMRRCSGRSRNGSRVGRKKREDDEKPHVPNEKEEEAFALVCRCLTEHRWYHGVMPRGEICSLLEDEGDFCVRKTSDHKRPIVCISVKHNREVRHVPLTYEGGTWTVKGSSLEKNRSRVFYEVVELLNVLVVEKITLPGNAVLVRAVPRPDYYIPHADIQLLVKLGEGAFGEVWKGMLRRSEKGQKGLYVAVKKMKGNATKAMTEEFVMEAKLMRELIHPNIVTVFGVAPNEEPLMIVLELAANGCLKSYVAKYNCPTDQLTQFATDAARGMAYLSSRTVIHRDLAARNLLLGSSVEVKISDFGLSSFGKEEVKISKMKLPIRWLAPETLESGLFTTKTDIWSYGVTMWEIFNRCATDPYPGLTNQQAKEIIKGDGLPMTAPDGTPPLVATIMGECFAKSPDNRPTFVQILKRLSPSEDITIYDAIKAKTVAAREQREQMGSSDERTTTLTTPTAKKDVDGRKSSATKLVRKNSKD